MHDLTDAAPLRRMSVARGRLEEFGSETAGADLGHAEAAAELAVKDAHRFVVGLHGVSPTHVETQIEHESHALVVTVTVQAFARHDLDGHALSGVCAALLSLRQSLGVAEARLVDLHLVQNVA